MGELVLLYISLFSIVNPFSSIPTVVSLTSGIQGRERRSMVTTAAITVFCILAVSYFTGEGILRFFSIGVPSLRVAGGIVLMDMGWSMLHARVSSTKQTEEEKEEMADRQAVAIVPIATPLLAGPGAISFMIIAAGRTSGAASRLGVLLTIVALAFTVWVVLLASDAIARALGRTGMNVATRFMGLIILATAVEFMTSGLAAIFPSWVAVG